LYNIKRMKDKVVVITGASSGIGKALAYEFGSKGSKIVLAARTITKLNEIVAELNNLGVQAIAVETDVTKEEDCRLLIEKSLERFEN